MKKLFWVDLEMTGLSPQEHVIIEFASIITDMDWNILDEMQEVIFQPQAELDKMDEWCRNTHGASGLTERIPSGILLEKLESRVLEKLDTFFGEDSPVLAGNSIHQDRRFIDRHMPRLSRRLHYRMLDVSSFKIIFADKYGCSYQKKGAHRALDDIVESIEELKYYLNYISMPDPES